jgi:phytol kinase
VEWFLTAATGGALVLLFVASEGARRRGIPSETTRSLVHLVGAGTAATFPLYLRLDNLLLLSLLFTALLALTWVSGSLPSIHAVARPSLGAVLFPIGLGLTALVSWRHPAAFAFGALVLALCDPVAAAAGQHLHSRGWVVPGGVKSAAGSGAFFLVAALLSAGFSLSVGGFWLPAVLAGAAILTAVEASLGYGLDNLPVPVVAAVMGQTLLGLP